MIQGKEKVTEEKKPLVELPEAPEIAPSKRVLLTVEGETRPVALSVPFGNKNPEDSDRVADNLAWALSVLQEVCEKRNDLVEEYTDWKELPENDFERVSFVYEVVAEHFELDTNLLLCSWIEENLNTKKNRKVQ